jgi:hypothetical protein
MATPKKCGYCRTKLDIGRNVIGVQHGVLGHERFIPLDEIVVLCSEECLQKYFDGTPTAKQRIP